MNRPDHIGIAKRRMTPQRAMSIAFVVAVHVAAIYALLAALMPQLRIPIHTGPIVVVKTEPSHQPPTKAPPLRDLTKPEGPVVRPPKFDVGNDAGSHPITTTMTGGQGSDGTGVTQPLRGIADTHTTPPYPASSLRLGEQGTVRLLLMVSADGTVLTATVEHSSGSFVLDQAAVEWVRKHWRYHPLVRDGQTVSATTETDIRFDIRNAR
jgi:protein TonB